VVNMFNGTVVYCIVQRKKTGTFSNTQTIWGLYLDRSVAEARLNYDINLTRRDPVHGLTWWRDDENKKLSYHIEEHTLTPVEKQS